jgi:hypothetical protein
MTNNIKIFILLKMDEPLQTINDAIQKHCRGPKELICYFTSDLMYKELKEGPIQKTEFTSIDDCCDFLLERSAPVYNIEIELSTTRNYSKQDKEYLKRKYGMMQPRGYQAFVFSDKYPYLRLFLHAFNIFIFENRVIICQSWAHKHGYKVIYDFELETDYDTFLNQLSHAVHNFTNDPAELYRVFRITDTRTEEPIFNMIRNERMIIQTDIRCYY